MTNNDKNNKWHANDVFVGNEQFESVIDRVTNEMAPLVGTAKEYKIQQAITNQLDGLQTLITDNVSLTANSLRFGCLFARNTVISDEEFETARLKIESLLNERVETIKPSFPYSAKYI